MTVKPIIVDQKAPLIIFGGAYGNLHALKSFKQIIEDQKIPPSNIISTGDMAAYCAYPDECARLIKDWGIPAIKGNVELSLAEGGADCGCGFEEGSACDVLSNSWFNFCDKEISDEMRSFMGALPLKLSFNWQGKKFIVLHGGDQDIAQFIFASTSEAVKQEIFNQYKADIVLAGHAGLPFMQKLEDGKAWFNSGALGMPGNDGTPRTWYLRIEFEGNKIKASLCPLEYDAKGACKAMIGKALPSPYADGLITGLWPSLDILSDEEKLQTGKDIKVQSFYLQ